MELTQLGDASRLRGPRFERDAGVVRYPFAADENVTQERSVQDVAMDRTRAQRGRTNGNGDRFRSCVHVVLQFHSVPQKKAKERPCGERPHRVEKKK